MVGKRPFCETINGGHRIFNIPRGSPLADRVADIVRTVMEDILGSCEVKQVLDGEGIFYRMSYSGLNFFFAHHVECVLFYFLTREISLLQTEGWSQNDIALDPEIEKNIRNKLSRVFGPTLDIEQRLKRNPT